VATKVNWGELLASAIGAGATALYYSQTAQANPSRAIEDAVIGTAIGGLFSLFTSQSGVVNAVADGMWAGGIAWLILQSGARLPSIPITIGGTTSGTTTSGTTS
jgi:hypothetical protein